MTLAMWMGLGCLLVAAGFITLGAVAVKTTGSSPRHHKEP